MPLGVRPTASLSSIRPRGLGSPWHSSTLHGQSWHGGISTVPRLPDGDVLRSPAILRRVQIPYLQSLIKVAYKAFCLNSWCCVACLGRSCGLHILGFLGYTPTWYFCGPNRITQPVKKKERKKYIFLFSPHSLSLMDSGRPKQPTGMGVPSWGHPALESMVRTHSEQVIKLSTELSSAFTQVTGEMGDLWTSTMSTSAALTTLSGQVMALTDLVTRLLPARVGEANPTPPAAPLVAPPPVAPMGQPLDPGWEPSLPPPNSDAGEFDRCRGFLGQCELLFVHQASRFRTDGACVALIMSTLTSRALDWAVAAVGQNPRLSSDLPLFLEEFRCVFDHPANGSDTAGHLHSLRQGIRGLVEYTLEFRTLVADSGWDDIAFRSAYQHGLCEEMKDLLVRDRPATLNDLYALALHLDKRLRERRLERAQWSGSSSQPTLSRLGTSPLSAPGSHREYLRPHWWSRPMQSHRGGRTHAGGTLLTAPRGPLAALPGSALPLLRGWGTPHPRLPNLPKRPGSLEGGVLMSRAHIPSPPLKPNSLFLVSLAWGRETLSVGALIDSGADECIMDVQRGSVPGRCAGPSCSAASTLP